MSRVRRYLARRAERRWSLEGLAGGDLDGEDLAVVIPALAEERELAATLASLAANPERELRRTLVVCVVNNVEGAAGAQVEDNQRTLAALRQRGIGGLRLADVDASSRGRELPVGEGVGLARKIGLDLALGALVRAGAKNPTLVCLDGDTRVDASYLGAVRDHFARSPEPWAARIDFTHRREGNELQRAAIGCYELYLRHHELGLRLARSPYAFVALGSTIACSAEAYAAVSGMNRRRAGEDFYFLQQLAKTGPLSRVEGTTVFPSSRPSKRVPFGTGPRVECFLARSADEDHWRVHAMESYVLLGELNRLLAGCDRQTRVADLLARARELEPQLERFLVIAGLRRVLPALARNAPDRRQLVAQLQRWFDGLKTLRLLHHLRDHGYPDQDSFVAIAGLCDRLGHPPPPAAAGDRRRDLAGQSLLLDHLRGLLASRLCSATACQIASPVA